MTASQTVTTWWLDWSALPDRFLWARLDAHADGSAVVLDLDGKYHRFSDLQSARFWLQEDEYSLFDDLVSEGGIDGTVVPPHGDSDDELLRMMSRREERS